MDINPITYAELDAFCRRMLIEPSVWEADLIMRLDDAALSAMRGGSRPAPKPTDPPEAVPVENVSGLKALFRGLAVKKAGKR
ncbi:MAG: hypothetical protein WC972_04805 [Trueperaceae bacterium]